MFDASIFIFPSEQLMDGEKQNLPSPQRVLQNENAKKAKLRVKEWEEKEEEEEEKSNRKGICC